MRVLVVLSVTIVLVSACTPDGPVERAAPADKCGAESFQYLKWQKVEVLEDVDLPALHRIVGPNSAVTMDFRPNRLNFSIGNTGRIEAIRCG